MFLGKENFEEQEDEPQQNKNNVIENPYKNEPENPYKQNGQNNNNNNMFHDDEVEDLDTYPTQNNNNYGRRKQQQQQDVLTFDDNNNSSQVQQSKKTNKLQDRMKDQQEKIKQRVDMMHQTGTAQQKGQDVTANNPNHYHDGIDFSKLQTLSQKEQIYEPGGFGQQDEDLPELEKLDNKFRVKDQANDQHLNIHDEGHSDDEEQLQKKNAKDDLITDLVSNGSSGDDEEETQNQTNQDENNNKEDKIQFDDDEDDEDGGAQVQTQPVKSDDKDEEEEDEEEEKKEPIAKPVDNLQIDNMREFLTKPLPKGLLLQCTIKRDKSGMSHFYPKYHLYLSSGFRYIMSGKKRSGCKTSNYLIGMDKNKLDKKSEGYLGKVRSNFLGTEFSVFDTGENPKEAKSIDQIRKELAVVQYESNLLGAKGPRKMRTLIPQVNKDTNEPIKWQPIQETDSMLSKFKQSNLEGMNFYYNKPPKWNEHVQAFVLNFNGRVDKPSVKNFQLVNDDNDEIIYLQFGRVGDDVFNMDLQWPMSPLQAFGICLSSFDYKIACE